MSMAIAQMGVYRAFSGHFDGQSRTQPSVLSKAIEHGQRAIGQTADAVLSRTRSADMEIATNLASYPVDEATHSTERDSAQLNQNSLTSSIDLAQFFLNLGSGTAPGPQPMRVQLAEENYLKSMGMF